MKAKSIRLLLTSAALTLACNLQAQYSLNWSRVAGGGGPTSGGGYSISGTCGQPDAAPLASGGGYTIVGGFWSGISSGEIRPPLSLSLSNNALTLSWPLSATGYNLEQTPLLLPNASSWTTIAPPYPSNLTSFYFTVAPPTEKMFFRLHKP